MVEDWKLGQCNFDLSGSIEFIWLEELSGIAVNYRKGKPD